MSAAGDVDAGGEELYDLAIVGYGPTGMTLAALMGEAGHRVLVLERYGTLYNLPRAACFDDEIMRTFQKLALVDEIAPGAVAQRDYEWVNAAGDTLLELHYDDPAPAGWAALYMMYQPHVETVLDRRCKSLRSVTVRQGETVDELEQGADCIRLGAHDAAGRRFAARARYVVGADGGSGFVRRALGVEQSDYDFQENWLVCDFRKRRELGSLPTFRQVCDPAQPIAIVQIGPDHHRFSFMLERDEPTELAIDSERVWARVAGYLGRDEAELVRVANYVFRSRIAERWHDGRCLLAGDAAHEMPPFLAQGMCSGMRDSHNLAWKLDLILRGVADPAILDSYQPEREPHVRYITEKAIELGRVQTLRDPLAAERRDARLLAQRRAREAPEKIRFPGLAGGLVAQGNDVIAAGELFPQGRVAAEHAVGRFDDLVGPGPCVVVSSRELLAALSDGDLDWWRELGGHAVVVSEPGEGADDAAALTDLDGVYTSWFRAHDCLAAVVRPDWYLFGASNTAAGLASILDEVRCALAAPDAQATRGERVVAPASAGRPRSRGG